MKKALLITIFFLFLPACGSLKVSTESTSGQNSGIPIYLPTQEFRVTELGHDKNGKPISSDKAEKKYTVSLVTRPDPKRKFYVSHKGALFASTGFSLERSSAGIFQSASGSSDENATEFIQTIGTFVGAAVNALKFNPNAIPVERKNKSARIDDEIKALKATHTNIASRLETPATLAPEAIEKLRNTLEATAERIKQLEKEKASLTTKPQGKNPSRLIKPVVRISKTLGDEKDYFSKLRNEVRCNTEETKFLIILKEVH